MLKKIFILYLFTISANGLSQEIINSFRMPLNSDNFVFDIKNDSTQTSTLFNISRNKILAIKLSENKQIIDSISSEFNVEKYSIVGSNYNKNTNVIYCKNKKTGTLSSLSFDFHNKKTTYINTQINLEEDNNIFNFSQDNKFYILYTRKGTNELKINIIDFKGNITSHTIDVSNFKLLNYYNQSTTLYKSIGSFYGAFSTKNFAVIDSKTNPSLIEASNRTKLYIKENQLIFTFDISKSLTQILNINLKDFSASLKQIPAPNIGVSQESNTIIESNSFLIDDKLFQFKLTPELAIISVKNLDGKLINTYMLKSENENTNNSNSYHITTPTDNELNKLKNSKDFLERCAKLGYGVGIYCSKIDNDYQITFGAISDLQNKNISVLSLLPVPIIGLTTALIIFTLEKTTFKNTSIYKNRFAVFTSLRIDNKLETFSNKNHDFINSEIEDYISKTKKISNFTISKSNENNILGFYDESTKMYTFRSFKN